MITTENGNILDDKYKIICHQVNTLGIMGAGLAKQIKERYLSCFESYKNACKSHNHQIEVYDCNKKFLGTRSDLLGRVNYYVGSDKVILSLFAQERIDGQLPRTDYAALSECFFMARYLLEDKRLETKINDSYGNILAIPYGIGCGLAGGDWDGVVYPMICDEFKDAKFDVVIVKYK